MERTLTQHERVLTIMASHQGQEWFYPPDIINLGDGPTWVGYEATARMSELASDYPLLFETRRRGKYKERRIRYEAVNEWWETLPENMRAIFNRQGIKPKADLVV